MAIALLTSASLLLQASASRTSGGWPRDIAAAANGLSPAAGIDPLLKAQSAAADPFFSVNSADPTKIKIDLFERVGKAFGIDMKDYDTSYDFGQAIRRAMGEIMKQPGAEMAFAKIEKDLGLDKLGVSLISVVNAITDPTGDDAKKLDAAIKAHILEAGRRQQRRRHLRPSAMMLAP
jgi:hypothetical protein